MLEEKHLLSPEIISLISVKKNINIEKWTLSNTDLNIDTNFKWSVSKERLKGGRQEGVDLIKVNNGRMTLTVIPTRGMSIHEVNLDDIRLGWDSPVKEIINPHWIHLEDNKGLGWIDGFNEWMVRCGFEFAGHPGMDDDRYLHLHGKIGNIPASEVEFVIDKKPPHSLIIRGMVNEVRPRGPNFELWTEISTELGSKSFRIKDSLTNKSLEDQEYMVIYHANFGPPLLEQGSQFHGTIQKVVPFDKFSAEDVDNWNHYGKPKLKYPEKVYCLYPFKDPSGNANFIFHNNNVNKAVSFKFPLEQIPFLNLWKNEDSGLYVTGLEPSTGFPNNRSIERKYSRVPVLKPNGKQNLIIDYTIHNEAENIDSELKNIRLLCKKNPELVRSPLEK